jgi:hypothetical protein
MAEMKFPTKTRKTQGYTTSDRPIITLQSSVIHSSTLIGSSITFTQTPIAEMKIPTKARKTFKVFIQSSSTDSNTLQLNTRKHLENSVSQVLKNIYCDDI